MSEAQGRNALKWTAFALVGMIAVAGSLAGGFLAYAFSVGWSQNLLVHVTAGLVTVFATSAGVGGIGAVALRLEAPLKLAARLGAVSVAIPVLFLGSFNLYEAIHPKPGEAAPGVIDALGAETHLLRTVVPDPDVRDLEPFRLAVGARRVVALGEATHGTSEFFTMKHRLVRLLVEEMGFRHFAMETYPDLTAPILDEYVRGGAVDPRRGLYWPWNTKEYMALLEWTGCRSPDRSTASKIFTELNSMCGSFPQDYNENIERAFAPLFDLRRGDGPPHRLAFFLGRSVVARRSLAADGLEQQA